MNVKYLSLFLSLVVAHAHGITIVERVNNANKNLLLSAFTGNPAQNAHLQ